MKKNFLFVALMLLVSMCFTSCSKDDDDVIKDQTVYVGDSIKLEGKLISYSNFIAQINGKYIKATHVGNTNISIDGKLIKFTAKGKYSTIDDPYIVWGSSIEQVEAMQKKGTIKSTMIVSSKPYNYGVIYNNLNNPINLIGYFFNNGKLVYVTINMNIIYAADFLKYLNERFIMGSSNGDAMGLDSYDIQSAKTCVRCYVSSSTDLVCDYFDADILK